MGEIESSPRRRANTRQNERTPHRRALRRRNRHHHGHQQRAQHENKLQPKTALALSPSVASEYERRGPRSLQQFGFGGGGCSSLSSILRVKQQEYQDKVQMMQIREENLRNKQVAASGRRRNLQGTDIGSDVLQAYNDA